MTLSLEIVALATAAIAAGAINAVAGGGTLLTFPALIAVLGGEDAAAAAVIANATSTVALFPGSLAAMAGYRHELWQTRSWAALLMLPSLLGGIAGALLVTELPPESFQALVPWLILTAAVLFAIQPAVTRRLGLGGADASRPRNVPLVAIFQLLVAVYGGYFGAGIGILMLTALAVMGLHDIHEMNALKTLLASAINGVAVVVFIAQGAVDWSWALLMAVSSVAGGYAGAHVARRVDRGVVRRVVVVIGFSLTAYYLWKQRG